jgi:methylated-DNA-[protein]-cysteine S-methyltransferase
MRPMDSESTAPRDPPHMAVAPPESLLLDSIVTPMGETILVTDERGALRLLDWADHESRALDLLRRQYGAAVRLRRGPAPAALTQSLDAYFAGDLPRLDEIRCAAAGTPFQLAVWAALRAIPPGTTASYGALAARLGHPKAMRAVGLANGANPIPIVVPCHRVIGADGSLTGYGGGLERKRWLLAHEGVHEHAVQEQLTFE